MKPDTITAESKSSDSYGLVAVPPTTVRNSDDVVQLLTSILRRVNDERFHPTPLSPEAQAAAHAYDRICSSLDHETPLNSFGNTRK